MKKNMFAIANAVFASVKDLVSRKSTTADPALKTTWEKAKSLPEGWVWKIRSNGTGALCSPDDREYFSYVVCCSRNPARVDGIIMYEEKAGDYKNAMPERPAYYGSLHEFRVFAEQRVACGDVCCQV